MPLVGEERREFQRIRAEPPIEARFGLDAVRIQEIGILGARLHHNEPLREEFAELRFQTEDGEVALKCEAVRTMEIGADETNPTYSSGVRFLAAIEDSGDNLRSLLARLVSREFAARRQALGHEFPDHSVDGDKTVRGKDAAFLCYRLENGTWRRRRVFLPEQPSTGFTVARAEDSAEMQRLCQVYEAADEEGRRLIRLFAELSVSEVLEIPPPH